MNNRYFLVNIFSLWLFLLGSLSSHAQVKKHITKEKQTIRSNDLKDLKNLSKKIAETEAAENAKENFTSEREDSAEGRRLVALYQNRRYHLKTYDEANTQQPLDSFVFKATDLLAILNFQDANGIYPDKIVLKFGSNNNNKKSRRWYLIAYGMIDGVLINDNLPTTPIFYSAPFGNPPGNSIDSQSAADLEKNYQKYLRLRSYNKCGNSTSSLSGFSFDSWQIREIISHNRSGKSADEVIFRIGLETFYIDEDTDNSSNDTIRWHVIAYGRDHGDLLDFVSDAYSSMAKTSTMTKAVRASIFDKADPCPPCN